MMLQNKARTGKLKAVTLAAVLIGGIVMFQSTSALAQSKSPVKARENEPQPKAELAPAIKKSTSEAAATGNKSQKKHDMSIDMTMQTPNGPQKVKVQRNTKKPQQDENGVYPHADVLPEFKGNLAQYLGENIKYPKEAQKKKIEGRVMIKFIVDEQGYVTDATVVGNVDPLLDNAALSVVKGMPAWKPGEVAGKKVKVYYMIPISFKLPEEKGKD